MNPFRYPEGRHTRIQTPRPFKNYRRYKPYLRIEFSRQCVYCRMPDGLKGVESFGVDHYRPQQRFPDLLCEYTNLFYSCNTCNGRKGDFWLDEQRSGQDLFIPNPCDHIMAEHLSYQGARVEPRTSAGQLAIDTLGLNEEESVKCREFMLRSIEQRLQLAEQTLEDLGILEFHLSEARGTEIQRLHEGLAGLRAVFDAIQEDLERLTGSRLEPI